MPDLKLVPVDYNPFDTSMGVEPSAPTPLSNAFSGAVEGLATLPQRAIGNSQFSLDTGTYDPAVPVEAALTAMTGGVGGVPARAGETVLGAGPVLKSGAMKAPSELYHVVGSDYTEGQPLKTLYSRLGDKAYDVFAEKWPESGDLGQYHAHRNFFYDNAEDAAQHADVFGGRVLRVDPSKVNDLYLDTLEKSYQKPGFWATKSDVPADALSPFAETNSATAGIGPASGPVGIRAYHGSPHDFDAFDLSKIGTGEGAQAYGHGLYFAENENVAKGYRDNLSQGLATPTQARVPVGDVDFEIMDAGRKASDIPQQRLDTLSTNITEALRMGLDPREAAMTLAKTDKERAAAEAMLEAGKKYFPSAPGKMYEVNINADPEHFLDWDKPLSEQPQVVQDWYNARVAPGLKTREVGNNPNLGPLTDVIHPDGGSLGVFTADKLPDVLSNPAKYVPTKGIDIVRNTPRPSFPIRDNPQSPWKASGANSYEEALAMVGGDKARVIKMLTPDPAYASQTLKSAGIPGIKYLDQGSRAAGDGSRNYVVFDDKLIDIIKKYGMAGLSMLPPATAAFMSSRIKPVDHDPFEPGAGALVPVDHDPFEEHL